MGDGGIASLRRCSALLSRRVGDEVLVRTRDRDVVRLIGTGPALWDALERPSTITDIAVILARQFGADPAVVKADIEPVIDALLDAGILCRD